MRNRFRVLGATAATVLAATTAVAAGVGQASAAPTSLYAPSALVLTLSPGPGTDPAAPVIRAATLSCAPVASGTHPAAAEACAQLNQAHGSFTALHGPEWMCTAIAAPVTVTADGVWQGKRVSYKETFGNSCMLERARGVVFGF